MGEKIDWPDEREYNVQDELQDFLYLYKYQKWITRFDKPKIKE